jgi:hypothetical protein
MSWQAEINLVAKLAMATRPAIGLAENGTMGDLAWADPRGVRPCAARAWLHRRGVAGGRPASTSSPRASREYDALAQPGGEHQRTWDRGGNEDG